MLAYPAGCVIVLLEDGEQRHITNKERKPVTCLAWAGDGNLLASGESGHKPAVKVWSRQTLSSLVTLSGHQFGVASVAFSPDIKYVVSVREVLPQFSGIAV